MTENKYNRFNIFYLLRAIHSNGNEYKTIDEIYNSLDPKIDKGEFDKLMIELKNKVWLDEHSLTHKIRLNNIGETYLSGVDREERERLRLLSESRPQKRPIYKLTTEQTHKFIKSAGIWILNNIIGVVIAGLILGFLIFKLKWN